MSRQLIHAFLSMSIGAGVVVIVTILQPHFVAGTVADLVCELFLLPGKLFAILFHDRGTASPEFFWRTRISAAVLLAGIVYYLFRRRELQA